MTVPGVPYAVLGLPPAAPLGRRLRSRLAEVERLLGSAAAGAGPVVDPSRPPFAVTGLRTHALLALLGAASTGADRRPATLAATTAELMHLAVRFHDQVLDGAAGAAEPARLAVRRRHNSGAVLAGDLLIVRATALAAELPAAVLRRWAEAFAVVHETKLAARPERASAAMRDAALALGRLAGGYAAHPDPAADAALVALQGWLDGPVEGAVRSSGVPAAPAAR